MEKIDVILPVYNCEHYLEKSLNNLKNQSFVHLNIFAIDDCSTDQSFNVLTSKSSPNFFASKNHENLGNLKTINKLLSKTKNSYIAFQDADDWSESTRLEKQLKFLLKNNLDFCFTNYYKTNEHGDKLLHSLELESDVILRSDNAVKYQDQICFASILMKRNVYEKIGGFNEYFNGIGGADIEWYYRAIKAEFKAGILNSPLYYYRNNPQSYTSTVSLDPRKYISTSIARFSYEENIHLDNNSGVEKKKLNDFISTELKKIGFSKKENLRKYIVQTVKKHQYLKSLVLVLHYLVIRPLSLKDFAIIKYIIYHMKHEQS
ncbi:glycosyltransferase family 2 protein [Nubsella zeaxanthinifaciens]|uniref:glycosyltransferase family 2 protein n=1 Tax=Nubsella zeaxanthinifaciens TaxID=392412 RepID=UPI000DE2F3EC|nr:glycosyltransferase family 2 protein [Nubsella zeaxanthinifaciens]